jgi:regulator of RNase E activity RraA
MSKRISVIDRCKKLYVAALSDGADEIGVRNVCMDSRIMPVTKNKVVLGFARPTKLVLSAVRIPYNEVQLETFMKIATEAKKDDVVVIQMSGATDCSGWGQIMTKISVSRGLRGAVVDGTVRDVDETDKIGFPVFARGRHPGTIRARLDIESVGEPTLCGGVTVHPGDLIFGDGDGVVVIPENRIEEVLAAAERVVATDKWWGSMLDQGKDPHELNKQKPIP